MTTKTPRDDGPGTSGAAASSTGGSNKGGGKKPRPGTQPVATKNGAGAAKSKSSVNPESGAKPVGRSAPAGGPSAEGAGEAMPTDGSQAAGSRTDGSTAAGGPPPASVPPAGKGGARPTGRSSAVPVGSTTPASSVGPRRVRLGVTRIDPWSVLKFSFLMSFAIGIIMVVGAAVLWYLLNGLHVFTTINDTIAEIAGDETKINFLDAVTFSKTLSLATILALVDIVLLTVLSTIFAFLYNITAALVGGVTVTLSDE